MRRVLSVAVLVALAAALVGVPPAAHAVSRAGETSGAVVVDAQAATVNAPLYGGTIAWELAADKTAVPRTDGFTSVTTFRGQFVAGRYDGPGVATSADGVTWTEADLPFASGGTGAPQVAAGPATLVVVAAGAAWSSTDGVAWSVAAWPTAATSIPRAVAPVGAGFVAVGIADERHGAAWVSTDGSTWTSVPSQPAFEHFCPRAVAASSSGRIVAVGDDCYPLVERPAVAVSDDGGRSWERASSQPAFVEEGALSDVISGGPGFIAAGPDTRDVYPGWAGAAIYTSRDGVRWSRVMFDGRAYGRFSDKAVLLAAIDGGYLAIATDPWGPVAYVSVDAVHWTRGGPVPPAPSRGNEDYTSALVDVATAPGRVVVGGSEVHALFVDVATSGWLSWSGRVTPGPAGSGLVAVPPPLPTVPPTPVQSPQPAFPGSVSWTVLQLPTSLAPPAAGALSPDGFLNGRVDHVAAWNAGFVILGEDGSRPVVWSSPDGLRWTEHVLRDGCGGQGSHLVSRQSTLVVASPSALCVSRDAVTWERVTDLPGSLSRLIDVVGTSTGFLLVQARWAHGVGGRVLDRLSMAAWASTDGRHWRVTSPWRVIDLAISALGSGPRGVVALGSIIENRAWTSRTAAMRSPTGARWTRGTAQAAFDPAADPAAIIAGGPGYLAIGRYQPRSRSGGGAWISADGLTWRRVLSALAPSGLTEFDAVARIGPGYAIVGWVAPPSQEEPYVLTAWLSRDAARWRSGVPLPKPDLQFATAGDVAGAAGQGNRLVATASLWSLGARAGEPGWGWARPYVWVATYRAP